jgi:hypothetical protein
MIQNVLVSISVLGSAFYLVRFFYVRFQNSKKKCTGCAVHQIYLAKKA